MALTITFTITPVEGNCRYITLSETTGYYDATNNPTGWDNGSHTSPNPAVSDILTAVLAVTNTVSGETWSTDLDPLGASPLLYDVSLNTIAASLTLDGTYYGLTASENIPYGNYEYTLHVTGLYGVALPQQSFDQEPSIQRFQYCTLECCVDTLYNEAMSSATCDPCDNKKLTAAQKADGWLQALIKADEQDQHDNAVTLADLVNEFCEGKCGCGC